MQSGSVFAVASDIEHFKVKVKPNYVPHGCEEAVFRYAWENSIPVILKGPTGCGKTRFVKYMAFVLDLPLITVSCHEDLTASDLTGRFLFVDNETVWRDGPLSLAARYGGICYLDEIVEARKDTTVVIHSLTDDRRMLFIDKTGELINADERFMLVMSYNPGYQNIRKELKESTKQRFISIEFDHPSPDVEQRIIESETGVDSDLCRLLADMGSKIRRLKDYGLNEGVSTRLLVYTARLIDAGLSPEQACDTAIIQTLTDDPEMKRSIEDIIHMFI